MKPIANSRSKIEQLFPNLKARTAADNVVDELPLQNTIAEALDAWEAAYYAVAGRSPFRKP